MLASAIDRIEARLAPHAKAISVVAAVWFWLGVALQAGFLPTPDLPVPVASALFWSGVLANALWWAWLRPHIEQRRRAREAQTAAATLASSQGE